MENLVSACGSKNEMTVPEKETKMQITLTQGIISLNFLRLSVYILSEYSLPFALCFFFFPFLPSSLN